MAAARNFLQVRYVRLPELLTELAIARGNGTYPKVIQQYKKPALLILDEWLLYASSNASLQPSLEKNTFEVATVMRHFGSSSFEATGEIILRNDNSTPTVCTSGIKIVSCSAGAGSVDINGEIYIYAVFVDADGKYETERIRIPFEDSVPVSTATSDMECISWGNISSVGLFADDHDGGKYNISVDYDLSAECCEKRIASLCGDAYSTDSEAECITDYINVPELIADGMTSVSVSGENSLTNNLSETSVISSMGSVSGLQIQCEDGKISVSGTVKIRTMLMTGNEGGFIETDIPLKQLIGYSDNCGDEFQSVIRASVCDVKAYAENETLKVSADVFITYEICKKAKHCYVKEVRLTGERPSCAIDGGVKVYYPKENENLWDVCKRYHADMGKILRANSIEGDTVKKGRPVIIF